MHAMAAGRSDERARETQRIEVTEFRTERVADYARDLAGEVRFERRGGATYLVGERK